MSEVPLFTARPSPSNAHVARTQFNRLLLDRLRLSLDVTASALPGESARLRAQLAGLDAEWRLSPALHLWHHTLRAALLDQNVPKARQCLAELSRATGSALRPGAPFLVRSVEPDSALAQALEEMSLQEPPPGPGQESETLLLAQASIGAVPRDGERGLTHLRERLDQAVHLVTGAAPDLAGELHALIHEVRFFAGAGPSLSSTRTFGTVFIAAPAAGSHPVRYLLDHLTREASHHLLFALEGFDVLLDTSRNTRPTITARHGRRPPHEYLHEIFVLARLIHLWRALADQGETWAEQRLHADGRRFTAAAETLTETPVLTASGQSVFDSCVRLADQT